MALPLRAQEQGPCQGSLSASSASAPALAKFTPAAERSGVVFHGWLDVNRAPPAAHLVIENTNPYAVAVRFEAELRGGSGPAAAGSRCVWIRARQFALDRPGLTVFEYPGATLSQIRIASAEVRPLDLPPGGAVAAPPRAATRPRPRVDAPRAEPAARTRTPARDTVRTRPEPARERAPAVAREAAPETLQASVPLKMVQDTLEAERSAVRARALLGAGKLDEARAAFAQAVRARPSEPGYHAELGGVLLRMRRWREAESRYRAAIALDASEPSYHAGARAALAGARQAPVRTAARPPRPRQATPPPLARAANTTMRVAAGMVLIPAGLVLGIAVAAAATLLGGIVPLGALRRGAVEKNVAPPAHTETETRG